MDVLLFHAPRSWRGIPIALKGSTHLAERTARRPQVSTRKSPADSSCRSRTLLSRMSVASGVIFKCYSRQVRQCFWCCSSQLSQMLTRAHVCLLSSSIHSHGNQMGVVGLLSYAATAGLSSACVPLAKELAGAPQSGLESMCATCFNSRFAGIHSFLYRVCSSIRNSHTSIKHWHSLQTCRQRTFVCELSDFTANWLRQEQSLRQHS